jgi:hypothetical protein
MSRVEFIALEGFMSRAVKIVLGAVAALIVGSAVQAADVRVTVDTDRDAHRQAGYYQVDAGGYEDRRHAPEYRDDGYRGPDRYDGRPVPDRDNWERDRWSRSVVERPHWRGDDDCRLIIKKREDAWGNVTVTRIKRCG